MTSLRNDYIFLSSPACRARNPDIRKNSLVQEFANCADNAQETSHALDWSMILGTLEVAMERAIGPGVVLLNKYRIDSMLGRGGMGLVVKAMHLQLAEEIAIKVLLPEFAINPDVAARFLREAQSAVRLRGEHVARISDVGMLPEGVPFMVMEYLRGIDLCGELTRRTALPSGEAVDYVLQACEALAEAHAHGIIHRDIKPANLFLTSRPDGTPLVKVLDFGISKNPLNTCNAFTRTDVVMGTLDTCHPSR